MRRSFVLVMASLACVPGEVGSPRDGVGDTGAADGAVGDLDATGDPGTTGDPGSAGDPGTTGDPSAAGDPAPGDPGTTVPTGTPAADEVRFNETIGLQRTDGVGACSYNFPHASDVDWDWSAVSFVFDELDLHYIRLAPWFGHWESTNDNADANVINRAGFGTPNDFYHWHDLPYAQFLAGRGIEVEVGIWGVSDWLAGGSPRAIAASDYDELGESIAAYVTSFEADGVPQHTVEVQNEPAIEASIQYPSADALRDAALELIDQLDRNGRSDILLHGPNFHTPAGTDTWAQVWLANATLRQRTAAVSYHTWWSDSFADYDAIRQVAQTHGKPVWATEVGYCALTTGCFGGTHFLLPETWDTAWDYAMSYYRAFAWSRASRVYHWTVLGHDAVVSTSGERYPSFWVLKHFANFIPPDARLHESASGDPEVLALAFARPDSSYSLVLLNTGSSAKTIRVNGVIATALSSTSAFTTREADYWATATVSAVGTGVSVQLPAESVTSLVVDPD